MDFAGSLETRWQRVMVGIALGIICACAMILLRSFLNMWAPTSGPFALVYPTVLIATLYGRWQAGLVAYVICFLWAWWGILPETHSFRFVVPTDPSRVAINAFSAMIVVIFAEAWRRAVREAATARDREIERRDMLMAELEHRTKNNFALVASLLSLQKRRLDDPASIAALDEAIGRVSTFAGAYANLTASHGEGVHVDMREYLTDVVERVSRGALDKKVAVEIDVDRCSIPRQIAVAVGLFANEALTNAAKYAFPQADDGRVEVTFKCQESGWILTISDNGIGDVGTGQTKGGSKPGLGTGLLAAFAQQAGASYEAVICERGRTLLLRRISE